MHLAVKRERAQLLSSVADRCQGKAAPYISLQRWVLSAYLADICGYANQRLDLMTSGRYQLRLTDEGDAAAARPAWACGCWMPTPARSGR